VLTAFSFDKPYIISWAGINIASALSNRCKRRLFKLSGRAYSAITLM